jgi:hypothetical protein
MESCVNKMCSLWDELREYGTMSVTHRIHIRHKNYVSWNLVWEGELEISLELKLRNVLPKCGYLKSISR